MIVLLLRLYWEFLLIGMFSMGGGMATVPFLFDLSQRTAWFSTADLTTMIAISEATPGPIGVNMATYVGYITAGLPGGIVAPLGLTTPAFIIILLVSKIMNTLWQNPKVQGLFYALRPASWPAVSTTTAWIAWPRRGSGTPTTLHSNTAGCSMRTLSISPGPTR